MDTAKNVVFDASGNCVVLLTISQLEKHYGYAQDSLTSLRAKGYFPQPDNHYGRTPLWRLDTVDKWMSTRRRKGIKNVD